MKVMFVHPAHYGQDGSLVQAKRWYDWFDAYLPHLGPALIAALTPERHDVTLVEEYLEDIDFEADVDVVALSGQIMQFDRCRDIAARFRQRGVKTVLGGYLPSLLPANVRGLFDAIVVGEGDELWPQILDDMEHDRLQPEYRANRPVDLTRLPVPRYDLINRRRAVTVLPVQATRGCPFCCQYCSVASVFAGGYRRRPIDHVVRDLAAAGSRHINFCDDNLCEDVRFAGKLFEAMRGMGIRWGTQTTLNVAKHPDLLRQARKSGCVMMAVGVETFSAQNLRDVDKTFYRIERYAEGLRRIADAGIAPHALIIFGLPSDDPDTFRRTVDYLEELAVPVAQFFILTPYPGTPMGDAMWQTDRVFDRSLSRLREPYVVYKPQRMTPQQLHDGWWSALQRFYSMGSIIKRLTRGRRHNLATNLVTNLLYQSKVRRGLHPVYFGF